MSLLLCWYAIAHECEVNRNEAEVYNEEWCDLCKKYKYCFNLIIPLKSASTREFQRTQFSRLYWCIIWLTGWRTRLLSAHQWKSVLIAQDTAQSTVWYGRHQSAYNHYLTKLFSDKLLHQHLFTHKIYNTVQYIPPIVRAGKHWEQASTSMAHWSYTHGLPWRRVHLRQVLPY